MVSTTSSRIDESDLSKRDELRLPELLAPAGDWDCAKAAVSAVWQRAQDMGAA